MKKTNSLFNPYTVSTYCTIIFELDAIQTVIFEKTGLSVRIVHSSELNVNEHNTIEQSIAEILDRCQTWDISQIFLYFEPKYVSSQFTEHLMDQESLQIKEEIESYLHYLHKVNHENVHLCYQLYGAQNEFIYSQAIPIDILSRFEKNAIPVAVLGIPIPCEIQEKPTFWDNFEVEYVKHTLISITESGSFNKDKHTYKTALKIINADSHKDFPVLKKHQLLVESGILFDKTHVFTLNSKVVSSGIISYCKQKYALLFSILLIITLLFLGNYYLTDYTNLRNQDFNRTSKTIQAELEQKKELIFNTITNLETFSFHNKLFFTPHIKVIAESLPTNVTLNQISVIRRDTHLIFKLSGNGEHAEIQEFFESLKKNDFITDLEFSIKTAVKDKSMQEFDGTYSTKL